MIHVLTVFAILVLAYMFVANRNEKLKRLWVTKQIGWLFLIILVILVAHSLKPLWLAR
jgi:hypothetical protein